MIKINAKLTGSKEIGLIQSPKIISLFSGAGGLDLGFKAEGFDIALALDLEEAAIKTHKKNFKQTKSFPTGSSVPTKNH